jgi:hypothetical protein
LPLFEKDGRIVSRPASPLTSSTGQRIYRSVSCACVRAAPEAQPDRFYLTTYISSKGWVALRLDVGKIDWSEVRQLLLGSYKLIAPKRLAERLKAEA